MCLAFLMLKKICYLNTGDIRFAEISKNDKGKSNGWGLVSFRREDDAQVAVRKFYHVFKHF
jgi:hypothetical protein